MAQIKSGYTQLAHDESSPSNLKFSFLTHREQLPINLNWRIAELEVKNILSRFGINFPSKGQFTLHAALCYPEMDAKLLTLALLWHFWTWIVDDMFDREDHSSLIEELIKSTEGLPPTIKNSHIDLLIYFLNSVQQEYPWISKKHRRVVGEYLQANFHRAKPKTWEEFLAKRTKDSGCDPCFIFVEIMVRLKHPEFRISPEIRKAKYNANLVLSFSNDIFSLEKEINENRSLNSINFLIERGFSKNEAVIKMHSFTELHYRKFEQILNLSDPLSQIYLNGIRYWILGTTAWVLHITPRYRSHSSPFPELRLAKL